MALMQWSEDLVDGVAAVDAQHKELAGIVNALEACVRAAGTKADILALYDDLVEHTVVHFRDEEKLFADAGFDGAEGHRARHEMFKEIVLEFRGDIAEGRAEPEGVLQFLADWLTAHIQRDDKAGCVYLNSKGIH